MEERKEMPNRWSWLEVPFYGAKHEVLAGSALEWLSESEKQLRLRKPF